MTRIRVATESDIESIWPIFQEVVSPGDTYAYEPETSKEDASEDEFRSLFLGRSRPYEEPHDQTYKRKYSDDYNPDYLLHRICAATENLNGRINDQD